MVNTLCTDCRIQTDLGKSISEKGKHLFKIVAIEPHCYLLCKQANDQNQAAQRRLRPIKSLNEHDDSKLAGNGLGMADRGPRQGAQNATGRNAHCLEDDNFLLDCKVVDVQLR